MVAPNAVARSPLFLSSRGDIYEYYLLRARRENSTAVSISLIRLTHARQQLRLRVCRDSGLCPTIFAGSVCPHPAAAATCGTIRRDAYGGSASGYPWHVLPAAERVPIVGLRHQCRLLTNRKRHGRCRIPIVRPARTSLIIHRSQRWQIRFHRASRRRKRAGNSLRLDRTPPVDSEHGYAAAAAHIFSQ